MSKLWLLILSTMAGTANANSECPEVPANQAIITSASHAIEATKKSNAKNTQSRLLGGF